MLRRVGVLIDGPAFVPHLSGLANLRLLWSAARRTWPPPMDRAAKDAIFETLAAQPAAGRQRSQAASASVGASRAMAATLVIGAVAGQYSAIRAAHSRSPPCTQRRKPGSCGAGTGGTVTLRVSNTGPAVPRYEIPNLFEPFRRLGTDRLCATTPGAGLGLSIVRAVAAAHDGQVQIEPREGGGLDVTVTLPAG